MNHLPIHEHRECSYENYFPFLPNGVFVTKSRLNLRNLLLINYLCAYKAPYKALYKSRELSITIEDPLQIALFLCKTNPISKTLK